MYARVVTGCLHPAALDRGLAVLEQDIRPHLSRRPGFAGWELLVDRDSGAFHAVTRWASRTEALGAARDGFQDRAGLLGGLVDGPLVQGLFEVLA